jgi:hypothetical protein
LRRPQTLFTDPHGHLAGILSLATKAKRAIDRIDATFRRLERRLDVALLQSVFLNHQRVWRPRMRWLTANSGDPAGS